jgi:RNA polymerase-interacting CarD/CdnL/TRCF family regulator
MRVDFSDWHKRLGLVARKYTYSKMGSARDTELEVHFDIQAGLATFTFPSFIINDLDLTRETSLRGTLRPMDDSGPEVSLTLMGRPDGEGGAVMTVFGREDQARCLKSFLDGKHMHFGVDASDGEKLIRLPLPNDAVFQTVYREVLDRVQTANDPAPIPDLSVRVTEGYGFNINEFVVYPAHGVGQILAIEEQEIAGAKLELFVINFMKDKMTLRVPTAKVANVGMRKLSDPALVKRALETLSGSKQFQSSEWSSCAQEYDAKINSGDIVSIAEVVRDLYRLESQPEQVHVRDIVNTMRGLCKQRHTAELTVRELPEKPVERPMFLAKITGVISKRMSLPAAPIETKKFPSRAEATEWLLGEALNNLPTPVNSVEVFSESGESVWREWHWSHDALKAKNEKWWGQRDPNRKVIEKLQAERRQKIASGEISGDQLSLAEQFRRDNPAWTGPHFASMPVKTIDSGWIWRREYWERPHTGLRYTSKSWFPDE